MKEYCDLLFVYGTLLDEKNTFGVYLKSNSTFLQKGRFKGRLYDIGQYPGAIADTSADTYVYGAILNMHNPFAALKELDAYEGVGKAHPQPNEYIRNILSIEAGDRLLNCWVYLYNWPIDDRLPILNGDYLQYINTQEQ